MGEGFELTIHIQTKELFKTFVMKTCLWMMTWTGSAQSVSMNSNAATMSLNGMELERNCPQAPQLLESVRQSLSRHTSGRDSVLKATVSTSESCSST